MCGTPEYMSPEILCEQGHDLMSDWWSLGIVLYELACGDPPYKSEDLDQMVDQICSEEIP